MKYLEVVASLAVPLIMLSAGILMAIGKKDYFSVFLNGAEEGLRTAVGLLPTLVILLTAVHMLRASGLTELLSKVLSTPAEKIGVPSEIVPLLLTRPFSGSASTAMFSSLLEDVGADGFPADPKFAFKDVAHPFEPKRNSPLRGIGMREGQTVGCHRMGEEGRIHIQTKTMFLGKCREVVDLLCGGDDFLGWYVGVQLRAFQYESIGFGVLQYEFGCQYAEHIA